MAGPGCWRQVGSTIGGGRLLETYDGARLIEISRGPLETFAPTLKLTSLRFMLAAATFNNWTLRQLDVTTAFLIAKLPESETIYMGPPPPITVPKGYALKLQRSIYGL